MGAVFAMKAVVDGQWEGLMDDHHSGPAEVGAAMDYSEHEKTYELFLAGAKWGTMSIIVLMIAMAAGFYGGAGLVGSLIVFIVLNIAGVFLLR
ncbi:aa3 type cytochrome c oxidase subunit IV [Rhizobium sp. NFR07]|nr:aa3 type cytochrome c oxidase subunit IV [Rhizobium sp. NFR07]